ncbi:MAG: hypothetical protein QME74_01305, partial [Candidatus Edwardsbacteria bacterium]|nr:hypothetical protein [Candidatus Edwardsbacteria bacterium]
ATVYPDARKYGAELAWKPSGKFISSAKYDKSVERQDSLLRLTLDRTAAVKWQPDNWIIGYDYQAGSIKHGARYWNRSHQASIQRKISNIVAGTGIGFERKY